MKTINLNEIVTVKLTAKGAKIINSYYRDLHKDYPLIKESHYKEGDKLREQLHTIMYMFGSELYVGAEALFENNEIVFTTEDEAKDFMSRADMYDFKLEQLERAHHDLYTREGCQDYRHEELRKRVDELEKLLFRLRAEVKSGRPIDPTEQTLNQTF